MPDQTPEDCDRCGRPLPSGGTVLFSSRVQTAAERLGRYGAACARRVVLARAEHAMLTYANGRGITLRNPR